MKTLIILLSVFMLSVSVYATEYLIYQTKAEAQVKLDVINEELGYPLQMENPPMGYPDLGITESAYPIIELGDGTFAIPIVPVYATKNAKNKSRYTKKIDVAKSEILTATEKSKLKISLTPSIDISGYDVKKKTNKNKTGG